MYYKVRFYVGSSYVDTSASSCTSSKSVRFTGTVSGLKANTRYSCYAVILYNSTSNSSSSGTYLPNTSVTTTTESVLTYPLAPTGVSVSNITQSSARISWSKNSSNGSGDTIYYYIYIDGGKWDNSSVSGTSYTVTDLEQSTRYSVRVYATNEATAYDNIDGYGSSSVSFTTLAGDPARPYFISVSNVSGYPSTSSTTARIYLSWSYDSSTGATPTSYMLERSTDGSSYTQVGQISGTTYTDTGLSPDTKYTYRIFSINSAGMSAYCYTYFSCTTYASPVIFATYTRTRTTLSVFASCAYCTGFYVTASNSSSSGFVEPSSYSYSGRTITINTTSSSSDTIYLRIYSTNSQGKYDSSVYYTAAVSMTKPADWSWTLSNGTASKEQTKSAYDAINNRAYTTNFSYLVWNDMVSKLNEINEYLGISWTNTYTTSANTYMSSSDKTLTAVRYNSLNYNLSLTYKAARNASIAFNAVSKGDNVHGGYFRDIATTLNTIISAL